MIKKIEVLCLCENNVYTQDLYGEHGLSYLINVDGHLILFDCGQKMSIIHNALQLNANLQDIKAVILSHGHFDHCGGLENVLKERRDREKSLTVYVHPQYFTEKYHLREKEKKEPLYIGPPFSREDIPKWGAQLEITDTPREILEGVFLSGSITGDYPPEISDSSLVKQVEGKFMVDDFVEEQSLIITAPPGLLVFSGCTHSGIQNTLEHARKVTGISNIHLLAGGLHLIKSSTRLLSDVEKMLNSYGVEHLAVSHCTGMKASVYLKEAFGEKGYLFNVGEKLSFSF